MKQPMKQPMKQLCCTFLLACFFAMSASAGTIDSVGTYHGTINGVGVGFFAGTGVGLTDGATCNGQNVVILLYTNPQYKDLLAVMLAAEASGKNVRMYRLLDNIQTFSGTYSYCVITTASLGDFAPW